MLSDDVGKIAVADIELVAREIFLSYSSCFSFVAQFAFWIESLQHHWRKWQLYSHIDNWAEITVLAGPNDM